MSLEKLLKSIKRLFEAGQEEVVEESEQETTEPEVEDGTEIEIEETNESGDEDVEVEESEDDETEGKPVTDLSGIGPTYGERLEEAGVYTVEELAIADVDQVVSDSDISESRVKRWQEQAQDYQEEVDEQ